MSFRGLLFSLLFVEVCLATTLEQNRNSIEMAIAQGDFFRAYRVASSIEENFPKDFLKYGLEGYLKSLFVIGSKTQIADDCARLSTKYVPAAYLCSLFYLENKNVAQSIRFDSLIKKDSKFFWPGQIIHASAELLRNKPDDALEILSLKDLEKYRALNLESLFNLTRARILIALELYDDAIRFSQAVDSTSPYYVDALEQTAWIFFKTRRLESSQILLDVLISSYESLKKSESDVKVSTTLYYRAKYLKAYLALVEQRQEGAANEFAQLKGTFDQFLKKFKTSLSPDKPIADTSVKGLTEMNELPSYLETQLDYLSEWLGADVARSYEKEVRFQVALNKEIAKLKGTTQTTYLSQITKLKDESYGLFQKQYGEALSKLGKSLETLSLKADLGRLDVFWLNRSDGAMNLEEVMENYKATTKSIDAYMEL